MDGIAVVAFIEDCRFDNGRGGAYPLPCGLCALVRIDTSNDNPLKVQVNGSMTRKPGRSSGEISEK
jgi:hypothetical protein